jgi:uncharacterized protein (DUF1810 family)
MNYDLNRFKIAQDNCYPQVLSEIKNGKKTSHWMWYIFPQISGLGKSGTAKKYEIENIEEAEHYLMDALLSKRLIELTSILAYEIEGKTAEEIFGFPDYLKFHSSMTLFYSVITTSNELESNSDYSCFEDAIRKYYNGTLCKLTLDILKKTTLFTNETPYQFKTTSIDQEDFNFKLEFIDIQPPDKWKPPIGTLTIKNKEEKLIATIDNAMGPICWSLDKKIVVIPICKMHWLKGFHQKFAAINFEKRTITFLKEMHKGEPRIIDKVEDDKFFFRHFNKDRKVVEGSVSFDTSEIEETTKF